MATKLYFHAATNPLSNLPTTEQSSLTSNKVVDAVTVNRLMDTNIGTTPASLVLTSNNTSSAQNYYFTKFVSPPLYQSAISANTWTYAFAAKESSTSANFPVTTNNKAVWVNVYVWRPSNSSKVGTIRDGTTTATVDEAGANVEANHVVTFSGAEVLNMQDEDVLVIEIWFQITQGAATAYTDTFYYDGTTESADNATVTTPASNISTPEDLVLTIPPVDCTVTGKTVINKKITHI